MNKSTLALALATLGAIATSVAQAKEGGDQYPNGAETFMAGALPPAGDYFLNYLGWYGGELQDNDGRTVQVAGKPVKVDAWFDALRWVKVTNTKLLGADYAVHAILPLVRQKMEIGGALSGTASGAGDLVFSPLVLGWHTPQLHVIAAVDVYLPTGKYDNDPQRPWANIGTNYRSIEPLVALTYLHASGFEASTKLMYNFKSRNKDTDYQSGDEFHADYLLGYHAGPWMAGLGGYYVRQTSDDEQGGIKVGPDGNRGRALAVGPHVAYSTKAGTTFIGQWQHETDVRNRFEGDKVWLKLIMPF